MSRQAVSRLDVLQRPTLGPQTTTLQQIRGGCVVGGGNCQDKFFPAGLLGRHRVPAGAPPHTVGVRCLGCVPAPAPPAGINFSWLSLPPLAGQRAVVLDHAPHTGEDPEDGAGQTREICRKQFFPADLSGCAHAGAAQICRIRVGDEICWNFVGDEICWI